VSVGLQSKIKALQLYFCECLVPGVVSPSTSAAGRTLESIDDLV